MAALVWIILLVALAIGTYARWRESRRWRRATFAYVDKTRRRGSAPPNCF